MSSFQKATRKKIKLKLAVTGPSGSGKSYGALRIASGMSSKIAFLDTENGSASLYSDRFNFDVLNITPPFEPDKFTKGLKEAADAGYEVVIIDSASHFWEGILDIKSKMDARGGNSYTNWNDAGKKFKDVLDAILQSPLHVICCMRSKMDYVQEKNDQGKTTIKKVGLAPIMRDGSEFEFTTIFAVDMAHQTKADKDRTGLFGDAIFQITEDTGKQLLEYLDRGEVPQPSLVIPVPGPPVTTRAVEWLKDQKDEVSRIKNELTDLDPKALAEFNALWPTIKTLAPSDAIDQLSNLLRKWQDITNQGK